MDKINLNLLKKRQQKEKRFKSYGLLAIIAAISFLIILLTTIITQGYKGFYVSKIALNIDLSNNREIAKLDHRQIIKQSLRNKFSDANTISEINSLYQLISKIAYIELRDQIIADPNLLGKKTKIYLRASSKADMFFKYNNQTTLNKNQQKWLNHIKSQKEYKTIFNLSFFTIADSREAEIAGIGASLLGSFFTMVIFLILAFPIAIMCAFYLEEFAPKNRLTDIVEISINNLAAIPSIIYGLLGLTIYLQIMHLPRSSALAGGMTLFMLVLPIIIIATRNTIRSIPKAIKDAALALGASKMQIAIHHLLPLSLPGIMTGTILAISRALGETAPLLMIGMVAFIADVPRNFKDPTTVLPVQIYLWSDSPEMGFSEKTSAAILILLIFLILFNLSAIIIRKKFEKKW
ncbi:MAG: phosphate ABC transporter, permease protein PstA [Rickettsiales bacterium]|jgi:phosphate transport system permease protein|nr:phosphate ABC transporter, permease protein PstA [Rickettsiales bacterium]|tara:strand:- start:1188 stop:2405 length:1218 start_codon:yes stop_codon:yes gene_type:complete